MSKDALDRWLQRATYGVALVRVLRGDDPKDVLADVERMNARARQVHDAINAQMGSPSSGSEGNDNG